MLRDWLEASLANRITAVMTLISASVILVGVIASFLAIQHLQDQRSLDAVRYLTGSAHQNFEQRIQRLLEDIRQLSESTIVRNALTDDSGRALYLEPLFSEISNADGALLAVSLNDHRGASITAIGRFPHDETDLAALRRTVTEQAQGSVHAQQTDSGSVLEAIFPVLYPPTGTTEGSLSVAIHIDRIFAETFGELPENYSSVLLPDASGSDEQINGHPSGSGIEFVFHLHLPQTHFAETPTYGARVIARKPSLESEILWLAGAFVLLSVLLIIAARMASLSAAERLLKPIHDLRDVAARITAGGLGEARLLPETGKDEVGVLTAGFNAMTRSVRSSQEELEMRVRLRTVELARAQRNLARILDSMQDIVYSASISWGQTYYVSSAFRSVGNLDTEPVGSAMQRLHDLIHSDDREELNRLQEHLQKNSEGEARYRIQRTDGSHAWLHERVRKVVGSQDEAEQLFGIISDITDRRDQEEWLRVQNRAMESSANGVVIVDMTVDSQPMLYANPAFERITGYPVEEAIGQNCRILQGPDTSRSALRSIRNALAQKRAYRTVLRNYRKDGSPFWNELSLSPVRDPESDLVTHYIGILNDITDRRETEEKLLTAFTRLDTLFSVSPDGFISFDGDGMLSFANPAFEQMFGLQSGDVIGMTVTQLDSRLQPRCDPSAVFPPTDVGDPTPAFVHVLHPVPRALKRIALRGETTETAVMVYFRDVTHETEVDRLKSEFLSTAAHELRTPLASIMGFSELLLTRDYDPQRARELVGTINRQSHQLTRLLNELLDLARIEARGSKDFVIERHNLSDLVQEALKSYFVPDGRAPATLQRPSTPCWVMVDSQKTEQAITNVLSNAFKYSPAGGEVAVEVFEDGEGAHREVAVRVTDHGIGMNEAQTAQAFERFFRVDKSGQIPGTGLGLSLVKEIVELQGGRVELTSQEHVGTVLTLRFPAA